MQRRASSWKGAVMAAVGQAAMQRVQEPQWFFSGGSGSSSRVVMISDRKNPVAQAAADEVGVLADEAETGALGQVALQQGTGVDVPKGAGGGAAELNDILS